MSLYEITLIANGNIPIADADNAVDRLLSIIKPQCKKCEVENIGLRDLAYPIKKNTKGYYYYINIELNSQELLKEFDRSVLYEQKIIRRLIVNLEKEYGYLAAINEKKAKKTDMKMAKYKHFEELYQIERANKRSAINSSSVNQTISEFNETINGSDIDEAMNSIINDTANKKDYKSSTDMVEEMQVVKKVKKTIGTTKSKKTQKIVDNKNKKDE